MQLWCLLRRDTGYKFIPGYLPARAGGWIDGHSFVNEFCVAMHLARGDCV